MQARGLRPEPQGFAIFLFGVGNIAQCGVVLSHHLMGTRRVRETRLEVVKNLLGEQAGGSAVVIKQIRIVRMLGQRFLEERHSACIVAGVDEGDAQRVVVMGLLEVRDGFRGVTLGEQSVTQQPVSSLEARNPVPGRASAEQWRRR